MDPLTMFPPEITDIIFKHLTVTELLTATEVSKTWNYVIGASSKAMQRIQLSMFWLKESMFLTDKVKVALVNSTRKYQHIDFRYQTRHLDGMQAILGSNSRNWKSVRLERLNFNSTAHIIEFLKLIEKTVVLELFDIYVASNVEVDNIDFKILKILRLKLIDGQLWIDKAFSKCRNLEELSVTSSYQANEALHIIFMQNPKLEKLTISSQTFNEIFSLEMIRETLFKLKVFKAKDYYRGSMGANLVPFLEKHMPFLEELSLNNINSETLKIIFHMPKLKKLRLGNINFNDNFLSALRLPVNHSIEVLSYHDIDNGFSNMKSIIEATPNVKELKMYSLTQQMVTFLSMHAKKLEKLSLRTIDADDVSNQELFPSLKFLNVEIISSSFEDHLLAIEKNKQNPFVKLILESSYTILH